MKISDYVVALRGKHSGEVGIIIKPEVPMSTWHRVRFPNMNCDHTTMPERDLEKVEEDF